jgi:hypothetical protein
VTLEAVEQPSIPGRVGHPALEDFLAQEVQVVWAVVAQMPPLIRLEPIRL